MRPPESSGFRYIGERELFSGGFFRLVTGTFVDPQGFTFEREMIRHPGAVVIVPLEDDGEQVIMVRQYRASIDRHVLELPAGKLDVPGEALDVAARRELAEEVGREAQTLTEVGHFYNSPGSSDELTTCFLAEGLRETPRDTQGVEEQHMTLETVPRSKVWALAEAGELIDGKTLLALAFTQHLLEERARVGAPRQWP